MPTKPETAAQFQLRPLVLEACAAFDEHLNVHRSGIAQLRASGVSEARIASLYPLDAENYRAEVEKRVHGESHLHGGPRISNYLSLSDVDFRVSDLVERLPPDLRWINPQLGKPLSRYQRIVESSLMKIVLLNNVQRWFEFSYITSLPTLGEQMWASRGLRDLKADGEHVGRFIKHFALGLGLPFLTNAPI